MNRCNLHQKQKGFALMKEYNITPKKIVEKAAQLLVSG